MFARLRTLFRKPAPPTVPVILDWSHAYISTDHGTYWRRGACHCQTRQPVGPVEDE